MADISLVSRVTTRRNYSKKHDKNSKNTTRRATSAIWRIFAELINHSLIVSYPFDKSIVLREIGRFQGDKRLAQHF